jgi:small subunit ribosomal protein S21
MCAKLVEAHARPRIHVAWILFAGFGWPTQRNDVQVLVRDNNVDQALKALKKKMQREGIFREMKLRGHYEKPSEKKAREKAEAIRRARKLARKRAQREGLLPSKPKPALRVGAPR